MGSTVDNYLKSLRGSEYALTPEDNELVTDIMAQWDVETLLHWLEIDEGCGIGVPIQVIPYNLVTEMLKYLVQRIREQAELDRALELERKESELEDDEGD